MQPITIGRALASDANGVPVASSTTATELGYVNGVSSSIQTQLNAKLSNITGPVTAGTNVTVTGAGTGQARMWLAYLVSYQLQNGGQDLFHRRYNNIGKVWWGRELAGDTAVFSTSGYLWFIL